MQFGADSILPVKFLSNDEYDKNDTAAILTLSLALSLPREKAKSMARLLLKLGATCSQADSKGCTAFHRFVKSGQLDLLDVLWDADKTGVKSAINHIAFGGHRWNPSTIAPLHSAIEHGSPILVLKLLNAGALTQLDFETWIKAAKVSPTQSSNLGDYDRNHTTYKQSVEQPIIAAVRLGDPDMAVKLLENGADPNTLNSSSESLLINEQMRQYTKGRSVLDLVRRLIHHLSKYTGETSIGNKPQEYTGLDTYLDQFTLGTFKHWAVKQVIEQTSKTYEKHLKSYQQEKDRVANLKGTAEKKDAIAETIRGLEKLESELLKRGGKGFSELHPGIETHEGRSVNHWDKTVSPATTPKAFTYSFSFAGESFMTETRANAYVEL